MRDEGGEDPTPEGSWVVPPSPPTASTPEIDPRIAGTLAYIPLGPLGGIAMYLVGNDPLSRFHGAQSALLGLVTSAALLVLGGLAVLAGGVVLLRLVVLAVWLATFGLSIYLAVEAYYLRKTTLPVLGPIADRWAAR